MLRHGESRNSKQIKFDDSDAYVEDFTGNSSDQMTSEQRMKQIRQLISSDFKCSVCFHMFVKPISLVCGHT